MEQNEVILSLRKEKGLTLEQLSSLTNISRNMLWHLEKGDRTGTVETLKKLAEFYDVSIDYITGNNERKAIIDDFIDSLIDKGVLKDKDNIPDDVQEHVLNLIKEKISNMK
ncbi:helix-turn-helix domain-containing protein [Clostridium perfringens]|uniref:helix-turn-helix domain-containing protein n=1 Tax=Clostridium perfringens TaxID=1502 RepID=UPI0022465598|nr:helix-turn-helix transcriptional regulator [Clostridium perfringens]MCX0360377.1 helix-turn-helix domain-containing protein [Clostridium perfringens]MCX0403444.1 helix-turn-helix domain-containing protein [Clostridium perfringens]